MRVQTNPKEDSAAGVVPTAPWRVAAVRVLDGYRLSVSFVDGAEGEVDLSRLVMGERAGVFEALRDPAVFAQARLEYGAVTWPGEIDIAPDAMHREIKRNGKWVLE